MIFYLIMTEVILVLRKLFDFEEWLEVKFYNQVHLLSLRVQNPVVLFKAAKNYEVIFDEQR